MKKIIILLSVAIAALAVSCNKVTPQDSTPDAPKGEKITITVSLSDALSKVSLTQDSEDPDGAIKVAWEEDDVITVIDAEDYTNSAVFEVDQILEDPCTATFTGTAPEGATSFNILYGAPNVTAANIFNSEQTQAGNASTDHLQYKALVSGVSSIKNIEFSSSWAEANGGSFSQNGALRLRIQVPAEVTSVASVSLTAPSAIFSGSETITVKFNASVEPVNGIITAYAMLPMGDAIEVAEGNFVLTIETAEEIEYNKTFSPGSISFKPGQTNAIKLNKNGFSNNLFAGGTGLEGDPYLIATAKHMQNMHIVMKDNAVIYFKMIDDIDMAGIEWGALNNDEDSGYKKGINFDGDNHTISNLTVDNSAAYPSFAGVINGMIKNLIFDGASITAGENVSGVLAGYVGSKSAGITGNIIGITVKNSSVTGGTKRGLGGLAGYVSLTSEDVKDCKVDKVTVESTADRVGGMFGQVEKEQNIVDCTAVDVTASGSINIGGLVGVGYGNCTNCSSSGTISSINTTSNADIALGGLIGYLENGTVSKCSSSVNISQTKNGRDIGGLVGKMLAATIEKSFSTGNVKGIQRNVGGFVGLITNTSGESIISNCYCTGKVEANAYTGGFLGLHEKGDAVITNCYSTSEVNVSSFAAGGLVGVIGSNTFSMYCSFAWNKKVTAGAIGSGNWSSGAVVGVTFPTCHLTDNYRNPSMLLKAYWGTENGYTVQLASDYSQPNVSIVHPLTDYNGNEMADTSTSNNASNPHYPIYPYNGRVDNRYTINQLAGNLNWGQDIWDFTGDLPTLK